MPIALLAKLGVLMAAAPAGLEYHDANRERAVERGLDARGAIARDPRYTAEYGTGLLWCLFSFPEVARDASVREKTEPPPARGCPRFE